MKRSARKAEAVPDEWRSAPVPDTTSVTRDRGRVLSSPFAGKAVATVQPSSLLRQPDEESREREYPHFVADLRVALSAAS